MTAPAPALALASAISCALVAGIFFAFSTFVMRALARLAPREGIEAMQSINIVVLNPLFFTAFFGAGLIAIATAFALFPDAGPARVTAIDGAVLYLAGCVGVTIVRNVPLNERLAKMEPGDAAAADFWREYVRRWTFWNHVRTGASLVAAIFFAIAAVTA